MVIRAYIQNQFLSNRETRTLHLDATFRNFVQGDHSVSEYCHKFKGMIDALADLGSPVDDWILILNILHGLSQRFEHVGAIIRRYSPFPNFLKVQDDLLPEEIHLDTSGLATALTVFYSNNTSPAPLLPPLVSCPPGKNNDSGPDNGNGSKNNNHRNGGNGGKNSNNGGNCGGNTTIDVDINTSDTSTPTHNQISGPITRARAHQLNNQVPSFLASYSSYLDNGNMCSVLLLRNDGQE
jgi:hypothetical protein